MIRFVFLFLLACSVQAETLTGRFLGIADGDTLTVLDVRNQQHKIRLAGIDAPEKSQPFGNRSKENLSRLAFGKTVAIEWNKQDRYGRTVGKVLAAGQDVNLAQVKAGMAWWYRDYAKEQPPADQRQYELTEQQARVQRLGLWGEAIPVPPWDFRRGTGNAAPESKARSGELCPCGTGAICTGPKGGRFCTTASGGKKYL